jgi:hypothetical protein
MTTPADDLTAVPAQDLPRHDDRTLLSLIRSPEPVLRSGTSTGDLARPLGPCPGDDELATHLGVTTGRDRPCTCSAQSLSLPREHLLGPGKQPADQLTAIGAS